MVLVLTTVVVPLLHALQLLMTELRREEVANFFNIFEQYHAVGKSLRTTLCACM